MIDLEQFCSALDPARPAGVDLEYDADFLALENAQKGRGERQFGDTVIPAEPPDWKRVLQQATLLSGRTRDLRVACATTRALTHLHGLAGLVRGLQLTDRLCRTMWGHVFPALDDTDDNDPTLRMNALAPLAGRDELLADLRDCVFLSARGMGACTVRQLEIALGILAPGDHDTVRNFVLSDIDGLATAAYNDGTFRENQAQQAIDLVRDLHAWLSERVGAAQAPDLQPLIARLRPIADYARKFITEDRHDHQERYDAGNVAAENPGGEAAPAARHAPAAMQVPGEIRTSQDAARMLDLICAYFEKNEPTNPAPLLLRRAQRLATMNFYDIVRDIAPDAINSVELVTGARAEQ
ncbi:type VI secretion system protein TssA [Noviherbaspirillum sp.]|uniref:type VI secretion system protein TssA n=1 Tax=Noviherbaspirillum sp. TaxID=1926288 RepID=UPI002FE0BFAC